MKTIYFSLVTCLTLWVIRGFAWFTPNNVLHQKGLGNLVLFDFLVSSFIGFTLAIITKSQEKCESKILFWSNQILSWSLFAVPVLVLIIGFVRVVFFGVSV